VAISTVNGGVYIDDNYSSHCDLFFHSPNLVTLAERSVPNVATGLKEKLEKWKLIWKLKGFRRGTLTGFCIRNRQLEDTKHVLVYSETAGWRVTSECKKG
jgi:hypothetical protein